MPNRDWKCKNCNIIIFGHKIQCKKCLTSRPNDTHLADRLYDWTCPGCDMFMFGSKSHCLKCNIRNPVLPENLKAPLAHQTN